MESVSRVRGQHLLHASIGRLEPWHPALVVRRPALSGWSWLALMAALLLACDLVDAPEGVALVVSLSAAAPSLGATLIVLSQTPRTHLDHEESILGHFFARFFAVLGALVLWVGSVVLGAAVAVQLAEDTGSNPDQAWFEAFEIIGGVVPLIIAMLWAVLVLRCVGYIARLRGWAAVPDRHRIPDHFFAEHPRTRRVLIGFAHPLLLLVAGAVSIVLGFLAAGELSLVADI